MNHADFMYLVERAFIARALLLNDRNVVRTADYLKMARRTLTDKLVRYGWDRHSHRALQVAAVSLDLSKFEQIDHTESLIRHDNQNRKLANKVSKRRVRHTHD